MLLAIQVMDCIYIDWANHLTISQINLFEVHKSESCINSYNYCDVDSHNNPFDSHYNYLKSYI